MAVLLLEKRKVRAKTRQSLVRFSGEGCSRFLQDLSLSRAAYEQLGLNVQHITQKYGKRRNQTRNGWQDRGRPGQQLALYQVKGSSDDTMTPVTSGYKLQIAGSYSAKSLSEHLPQRGRLKGRS